MIYTHALYCEYISRGAARNDAASYVSANMTDEEIKKDVEDCLKDSVFEEEADRAAYINGILEAAETLREEKKDL